MTARRYPLTRRATPDTIRSDDWRDSGSCATPDVDPEWWFPADGDHDGIATAKRICLDCPVMELCLRYAIEHDMQGIWGATDWQERRHLGRAKKCRRGHDVSSPDARYGNGRCKKCERLGAAARRAAEKALAS